MGLNSCRKFWLFIPLVSKRKPRSILLLISSMQASTARTRVEKTVCTDDRLARQE